jgi:hypothetical protein
MTAPEQRKSERLLLRIPIRVIGFETTTGEFSEDTYTSVVNRAGARIALRCRVAVNETLRIINLENYSEADFRVVAPTGWAGTDVNEWGVECLEPGRNIWGIEFAAPLAGEAGALIECQECHKQVFWALTPMDVEVLEASGITQRHCSQCDRATFWMYAGITRRPAEFPPPEALALPARPAVSEKEKEKRRNKRLGMKLPILVRGPFAQEEVSKTENVSKAGLAVSLGMDLAVGDVVRVVYPYTPGGENIEQKTEVRRRASYAFGGRRLYGLRLLR